MQTTNDAHVYTVSNMGKVFNSYREAHEAWIKAGAPFHRVDDSVWIAEHRGTETISTTTIAGGTPTHFNAEYFKTLIRKAHQEYDRRNKSKCRCDVCQPKGR